MLHSSISKLGILLSELPTNNRVGVREEVSEVERTFNKGSTFNQESSSD